MSGVVIVASALCTELMAALHRECFGEAAWSATSFAALFETSLVFGYLIESGGLVLARAVADEAEILTIGVVPAVRRQGLARQMVALVIDEARTRGAQTLFLEVSARNTPACELYRAAMFDDCGRRRDYYGPGDDALLLKRPLCE
jgi:ribosomal-protein-alanine N-acetyltransferase